MRKITIVEVENSFLTLFTPAVVVAAAYILFNVVAWPTLIFEKYLATIFHYSLTNVLFPFLDCLTLAIVIVIVTFIFIPRLKVKYVDYKSFKHINSFLITGFLLCGAILTSRLFYIVFDYINWELSEVPPFKIDLSFPIGFLLVLYIIITAIFDIIIFARTIIPLLEDRGISPSLAIIFASFGSATMSIPPILLSFHKLGPDHIKIFFLPFFISLIVYSAYILTRNILFPIILLSSYELSNFLPNSIYNFLPLIALFVIIFGFCYWAITLRKKYGISKELTKKTAPMMERGIVGFFVISVGLLVIQSLIASFIRIITDFPKDIPLYGMMVTMFYFLLFLIPFLLTVSTEYASD